MKKKILFLNLTAFSQTGGIERFNKCFLRALSELDKEAITDSASFSAYDTQIDEQYYTPERYKGFGKNKASFVLQAVLAARKYDTIILGHVNLAAVGILIKRLYPTKKLVLIAHGIDVWGGLPRMKTKVLHVADQILSVSSFTKNKLVKVHNINADKITVFHNTIDPEFPVPEYRIQQQELRERYGLSDDDFVLYTLSRLKSTELFKGYDSVIKAVGTLSKEYPQLKYVLAGKYDEAEKARIDQLIADEHAEGKVIVTGYLNEQELVAHYQMADTYIMPSKKEGFGIVFIEALVSGTPVIAGNADGSADALMHGELGTLVNPDSIEEIKNAITTHIKQKPEQSEGHWRALKAKTLDNFSFERYKQRLKGLVAAF